MSLYEKHDKANALRLAGCALAGLLMCVQQVAAAPRVNVNVSFDQFTDGTSVQATDFPSSRGTWSYFDDETCLGGGVSKKCVLGWRSTITPSTSTDRVEVAYARTYGYTNSNRVVAEVNSTAPSRLYYNICLAQGESLNVSYQFAPRSGTGTQQVRVGLWSLNSTYPATALSSALSTARTFSSTTNPGFTTETTTLTAPSAGSYQLGLEAVQPSTGSNGNIIDDLTFTLIPLIDLGRTGAFTLKEGSSSDATKALRLRINGTVPTGGITLALRRTGTAVEQDIQLGTPTGLVNTTPTLSHPSADIWLVFVPAGAYDAGELGDDLRYGITIPIVAVQDALLENPEAISFSLADAGVDGSTGNGKWRSANPICEGTSQASIEYNILPAARLLVAQDNLNTDPRVDEKYQYHIEIDGKSTEATQQLSYAGSSTQLAGPVLLAQGTHTLTFKQSVLGTVPLGMISPYQVRLLCNNTNTDTTATVPSDTAATTFFIPFNQSKTITLQNLGDGDYVTCTFENRNQTTSFAINGRVFNDNSGSTGVASNAYDGRQQTGELGLSGAMLALNNCNGTTYGSTQTNALGDYSFTVPRSIQPNAALCLSETNLTGYASVSGGIDPTLNRYQYSRSLDRLQWTNANTASGATVVNYDQANFGDAWLNMRLVSDGQQTIRPSEGASYAHTLTNDAVLTPSFSTLNAQQPANATDQAWTQVLYRDDNCNGVIDSGEKSVAQQPYGQLLPNSKICVVQRVNAPSSASSGATLLSQLTASYQATLADGTVLSGNGDTRQDLTVVSNARLDMAKQVRTVASCPSTSSDVTAFSTTNSVKSGSWLEYEILYQNNGTKPLSQVVIKDELPALTQFGAAYCQQQPTGSSCQLTNSPTLTGGSAIRFLVTGGVPPSAIGSVRFCVRVP